MKKIAKAVACALALVMAMSIACADVVVDNEPITADNNYTVSSADNAGVDSVTFNLTFNDGVWNDWCQVFVKVTADGVDQYHVIAGGQANWNTTVALDADGNKYVVPVNADSSVELSTGEILAPGTLTWATVADVAGENETYDLKIDLAGAADWTITFFCPAWNNQDSSAEDPDGTSQDLSGTKADAPYVYTVSAGSAGGNDAPAPTDAPKDDTPKTGDATSIAVLAVAAVLALGGVVVSSKKRA